MRRRRKRESLDREPRLQPAGPALRITARAPAVAFGYARDAAPDECMGLLASRRGDRSGVVTHAVRLRAEASLARAEADPLGIAEVVVRLRRRGRIVRGIWHSHVEFAAHHSSVDDATMTRLLPGMADDNFTRPVPPSLAPAVTAPDEARLPLPDGTALRFSLVGPPIPGFDALETAHWASVTTRFRDTNGTPRAVVRGGRLDLIGGPVVLSLEVPVDARLISRIVDAAAVRTARMFSLVVNVHSETYCEALTVHDLDGRTFTEMGPCAVEVAGPPWADTGVDAATNGRARSVIQS